MILAVVNSSCVAVRKVRILCAWASIEIKTRVFGLCSEWVQLYAVLFLYFTRVFSKLCFRTLLVFQHMTNTSVLPMCLLSCNYSLKRLSVLQQCMLVLN